MPFLLGRALRIMASSTLTVGRLVTFLNYVQLGTLSAFSISSVLAELQSALACRTRVVVFRKPWGYRNWSGKSWLATKSRAISASMSPLATLEKILIKGLSIDIPAGNGCTSLGQRVLGESTLINLLMRFYPINSGDISLDGHSIYDILQTSLRQQFGMVLQRAQTSSKEPFMTILLLEILKQVEGRLLQQLKAANADFFIQQLPQGCDTKLENQGESLSVGQAQCNHCKCLF